MGFFSKLNKAIDANSSLLCVGLDPLDEMLPDHGSIEERLKTWGLKIIEQTSDLVCCYKPNFAFFEKHGLAGLSALKQIITEIPDTIPVLLDVKRGDIGSTAAALADAAYQSWNADAVTLSPYLGADSIKPFILPPGKAAFILCYTSNPSAVDIQKYGYPPLFEHIAQIVETWGNTEQIGLVVGATQPDELARVREICPQTWILAPGVGAQGGDLEQALQAGLRPDGRGLIIPVSRGILSAPDPRKAAYHIREDIQKIQEGASFARDVSKKEDLDKEGLIIDLFEAGCIKFGDFTLASGKKSPIYIDLRRIISFPKLFEKVTRAISEKIKDLDFDQIAPVPYAALPIGAAVAMTLKVSMIYPRKEIKDHGTGQSVEGNFTKNQQAVLIEDVITTGSSIISAWESLIQAGLIVKDVVVLVDREQGGFQRLKDKNLRLLSILKIEEIIEALNRNDILDSLMFDQVEQYLRGERINAS